MADNKLGGQFYATMRDKHYAERQIRRHAR